MFFEAANVRFFGESQKFKEEICNFAPSRCYFMYLHRILITDFKNIREAALTFSPKINCFSGNNGAGKTNILDAIYYLSVTKSYFGQTDTQSIRFGAPFFALSGHYHFDQAPQEHIHCAVKADGEKTMKRNDKVYARFSEHLGLLPLVMVSPSDTQLIHAPAEERRRFMNVLLAQVDVPYLSLVQQYNQVLLQRNRYLKEGMNAADVLSVLDKQLSDKGQAIYEKRKTLCEVLAPEVEKYYGLLSGKQEVVGLQYRSDLDEAALEELLQASLARDQFLHYTSQGVHRDDMLWSIDGHPIKKFGSQGQQKTFLVALKLAQFEIMKTRSGLSPLLLLDDVFDKLDMDRVAYLLRLVVNAHFGQIFLTDSNKARIENVVHEITDDHAFFKVSAGEVTQL
jgi:recF protein